MDKILQYSLCHNPFLRLPEGAIDEIVYRGKPQFFAFIFGIDLIGKDKGFDMSYGLPNKLFMYDRGDGPGRLMLILVDKAIFSKGLLVALENAALWYTRFLNINDEKKYGKRSSCRFLHDFNVLTPGLQIVHLPAINKYIVSSPGSITSFEDLITMDEYLSNDLQYSDLQLEEGKYNILKY